MKWIAGIALALAVLLGIGWIFRAEIALFGINRMMAGQMEIGPTQAQAVSAMMAHRGFDQITVHPDLDGRDRVVSARFPAK